MKRNVSGVAASLCLVLVMACSEDLGPVTAAWNQLSQSMTTKIAELKKQFDTLQGMVKTLPALPDGDAAGKALKAKLDQALAAQKQGIEALDSLVATSKSSFDEAVKTGKIANVQKVIDDTQSRFDQLSSGVTSSGAGLKGLIDQYQRHLADMAKPEKVDFTDIDFKPGTAKFLFDRPSSKATLDKLTAYMKACPQLVVDLVGHTSNEGSDAKNLTLSIDRAKAVKQYLVTKGGVEEKKFRNVAGVGAQDNAVPEPAPGSPEAKKMGAKALEEIRRKNRRITVTTVTPCPK
ncbi:MAG TPA: OmpA family protein [Myxococcaceae bacterium]|nr:OmpA family protein [Myxococcaceae bacterium]